MDDGGRSYRAIKRITRWPVGTVYAGEIMPSGASCTVIFPDVLGGEVEAFLREWSEEIALNKLLAGLPILGATHAGQNIDRRAFVVLPPLTVGASLEEHVRSKGPFRPLVALQIAVMLADALGSLHNRMRAVGEIRPWQVLLPVSRRESLRLFDLGIPRGLWRRTISPPRLDGLYASPSVRAGRAPDIADDIYAIGALLFFMLTGEPPPRTGDPFPSERVDLGPFASYLDGVLLQAMAPDPDRGAESFGDTLRLARSLRGLRDLNRLSPSARKAVLKMRAEPERTPVIPAGAQRMPTGALGFVVSDGPSFLTQADLETIESRMNKER